jgi:hypothetical protein
VCHIYYHWMAEWKILDLWKIHQIYIYISSCSHVLTTYSKQIYTVYSLMQCGNPSHVCGIIIPLFNPSNKQKQCRYIPKNTPKKKPCTSLHVTQLYHYIIYKQFANLTMDYFEGTSTGNHLCLPNMFLRTVFASTCSHQILRIYVPSLYIISL